MESQLEAFFRKRVRLLGGYTIKLVPLEKGVPDRLVIFPTNRFYLVELKTETGSRSPAQLHWHANMWERWGVRVQVLSGREEVVRWLATVVEEHSRRSAGSGVR